jgi:hypothetical protein
MITARAIPIATVTPKRNARITMATRPLYALNIEAALPSFQKPSRNPPRRRLRVEEYKSPHVREARGPV